MSELASQETRPVRRSVPVRAGVAVALAVVGNAVLLLVVDTLGVAPDFRALTFSPVVFLSTLGAVGAAGVYALLARRVADPDPTFQRVAGVVLVASFLPDVALLWADPAATLAGVVALMAMHAVVAVAAVGALSYWGR